MTTSKERRGKKGRTIEKLLHKNPFPSFAVTTDHAHNPNKAKKKKKNKVSTTKVK